MATAGVIVIGNEVLSGKVEEENARYLIRELRALGIQLERVVVVRDVLEVIAAEVRAASASFDHVFTSGGVGATHDDVTMAAVARAFGVSLVRHTELERLITRHYRERASPSVLTMADLPEGAELVGAAELVVPLVRVRNVYVMPGVPSFFRAKFSHLKGLLADRPFVLRQVFVRVGEDQLADWMRAVQSEHPDVEIGSYPRFDEADHRVKITLEAKEAHRVEAALARLLERIDRGWIVRVE